jgi:hypothetical protein
LISIGIQQVVINCICGPDGMVINQSHVWNAITLLDGSHLEIVTLVSNLKVAGFRVRCKWRVPLKGQPQLRNGLSYTCN